MNYLLDTNVFIEAKNRYYAFDLCPGFWDWIDHVAQKDVGSVLGVCDELCAQSDELSAWATERKTQPWFLKIEDKATQESFAAISEFVSAGPYHTAAKAKFLSGADPWLIAKASVLGYTVVTHEQPAPDSKKRVPIPDICDHFSVKWMPPFDVMRLLKASFSFSSTG